MGFFSKWKCSKNDPVIRDDLFIIYKKLENTFKKVENIEQLFNKKGKEIMDALEKLTAVVTEMAEDSVTLADEVTVIVDLLKEFADRHEDEDLMIAVTKLEEVHASIEGSTEKLREAADAVASSGGDADEV